MELATSSTVCAQVATRDGERIASFRGGGTQLPDFLTVWPVLESQTDLAEFIRLYKQDGSMLAKEQRMSEARTAPIQSAAQFHTTLKARLGRR